MYKKTMKHFLRNHLLKLGKSVKNSFKVAYHPKTLWLNFPIFSFVTSKIPLQTKNKKMGVPDFVFDLRLFLIFV